MSGKARPHILILAERGLSVTVQQDTLVIAHDGSILHRLARGQQDIGGILFLSTSQATLAVDVLFWCTREALCMRLQAPDGTTLWSLTPNVCESIDLHLWQR